jgi:ligand-binding SRPBCC domain-containing protein
MKQLRRQQLLPVTLQQAWQFFATPANLNAITPPDMDFKVLGQLPETMYQGQFIMYTIKPVLNIPFKWVTEITHINEPFYFVDEQRTGPYHIWHHEHHFKAVDNGVLMTDILHYDIGKWVLGSIAGALFVHKKVEQIFDYRYRALEKHFGPVV